jgi:two-component system nitrate/nitrite response regulator NarL
MDRPIRLLLVAADPLVRSGLSMLLEGHNVCEISYVTSPAMLRSSASQDMALPEADLALWDMGWESGELDALDFQDIVDMPVVALVADDSQAVQAWNAGARAIFSRQLEVEQFLASLRPIAAGLIVLDPDMIGSLLPAAPSLPSDLESVPTPRELEVLQLVAEGMTNKAIAQELQISEHTVKFHINAILSKLDAQSRTEAVVIATRLGFISL